VDADCAAENLRSPGLLEKVSAAESDAYFVSRPVASRLGAWASQQSSVLSNREELEERFAAARQRFPDDDIPRPENWGGYRLVPNTIEFCTAAEASCMINLGAFDRGQSTFLDSDKPFAEVAG
jgi:pyridoxine/pyridoxamine 5'-phosphate oxidase